MEALRLVPLHRLITITTLFTVITAYPLTIPNATLEQISSKPTELIIFIHGTMPPAQWRISDFFKIVRDAIENSIYQISARYIRKDPFFRRGQVIQDEGLHPIPFQDKESCASMMARMYEQQYEWIAQENPERGYHRTRRCYYTFGWNGMLHVYTRYEAAKTLYKELLKELRRLKQLGIEKPTIRIITFSHGGNIALNLAAVQTDYPEFLNNPITIDELIMFATPVQKATDYLTHSPLFKKIYHIYSANDQMQTMDFTCPNQWFSKRIFKKKRHESLPETLVQVQMRITKNLEPRKRHFLLPDNIDHVILNDPHYKPIYDDPHHTEFWHFQWGAARYRNSFALAPLPICAFVPTLMHTLQQYAADIPHVVFNFAPVYHSGLITELSTKKTYSFPLLSETKFEKLRKLISDRDKILIFDKKEEENHLMSALEQAEQEYKTKNPDMKKHAFSYINHVWQHALG